MELIDQQVINDNKEIYAKIQSELLKAEFEILIATAWFTDNELFDILLRKLSEGVHIEVIIADNQENEKLDFNLLTLQGASVHKIKNAGYGTMNQKFCVIDKRIALHGSYNWTVNAKKNNQESIISTNHQETIESLVANFNAIKAKIREQKISPPLVNDNTDIKVDRAKILPAEPSLMPVAEFEKVLDSMIAAEVGSFDRKLLRGQGFERCAANNGDHQVLHKAFDTLYSVFINDIDVIEDKKKRLITKIEEHRVKSMELLNKDCEMQVAYQEREHELDKANLQNRKTDTEADQEVKSKSIKEIKEDKIPAIEKLNADLDQQIKRIESELIKPHFKWFDFIPTSIFTAALIVYLFLFYSSAAYILLFSVADAKEAEAKGLPIAATDIFNPEAVSSAWHKSGTAPYFIFLFVFIPLAFAVVDRFVAGKWVSLFSTIGGILILDVAIAYKVTQAVYEVNYARGNVNTPWRASMAFTDTNFYLVFVFGAFGLLLFKLVFKKLMSMFEDRNPDIIAQHNQLLIQHRREESNLNTARIKVLKDEMSVLEENIIQLKATIKHLDQELSSLPILLNQVIQQKRTQLLKDTTHIDQIAAIYTTHIQSDNLPISVDALKDRINVFLEGWNDFLHQEYAVTRAILKAAEAAHVALEWQSEKLDTNKVDKRIKSN
ncbi:hypothetical protein HH214_07420 [Mucilaginibacter robiniae]|uniref:phospholipase D n=1 Tax=Mucilaginibacter robiniae TaxID=2728022 RepID=A0A7L5DX82_9SPHI|nr:phospholipase D-like domain-containing protein [Mucilaginibacter robiniae]QJD95712.1 hypothetical protein HH214_07420 [Mucilaginibacter robiniae]